VHAEPLRGARQHQPRVVGIEPVQGHELTALAEGRGPGQHLRRRGESGGHQRQRVVGPGAGEVLHRVEQHRQLRERRRVHLVDEHQQAGSTASTYQRGGLVEQVLHRAHGADRQLAFGASEVHVGADLDAHHPELDAEPGHRSGPPALRLAVDRGRAVQRPVHRVHELGHQPAPLRAREPGGDEAQLGSLGLRLAQQRGLAQTAWGVQHEQPAAHLPERVHAAEVVADPRLLADPADQHPGQLPGRERAGQRRRGRGGGGHGHS
jgi:hypothetical protein